MRAWVWCGVVRGVSSAGRSGMVRGSAGLRALPWGSTPAQQPQLHCVGDGEPLQAHGGCAAGVGPSQGTPYRPKGIHESWGAS